MSGASTAADLLEREQEVADLERLVADAAGGHGGVLLVEGAAGVGKSALLREVVARGQASGARVLSAVGGELEREFPFGMVRQLLEPVVLGAAPERRDQLLSGSASLAGPVIGAPPQLETPSGADASFATLHGIYWLVAALADEQPLILVLDDAHWADAPSLRFADFLARRVAELPVLLAFGLRPREPGAETALLENLATGPDATILQPRVLSSAAVAQLVTGQLANEPAPDTAAAAHEATGGNPLLLRELLRSLGASGQADAAAVRAAVPSSVTRSVQRRLDRQSAEARTVASALAVLGDRRATELLAEVTGIEAVAVARALDELRAGELVLDDPPRYIHPLVRQAVVETVPIGERHALHRRAVDALRDRPGAQSQLVVHLLAIPPVGEQWVVDLLRDAARRALAEGAPDAAVRRLARAAEESGAGVHSDLLLELGLAEASVGAPGAFDHLDEAVSSTDAVVAATALQARGALGILVGATDNAGMANAIEEAIERVGPDGPPELLSQLHGTLLNSLMLDSRLADRWRRTLEAKSGRDWDSLRSVRCFDAASGDAPRAGVIELAALVLDQRPFAQLTFLEQPVALWPVAALNIVDGPDLGDSTLNDAESTARRHGSRLGRAFATFMRGEWLLAYGSAATAEANAREARDLWTESGIELQVVAATVTLAQALVRLGRLDEADALLATLQSPDHAWSSAILGQGRAELRLAQGRPAEAVADLRGVQAHAERFGWPRFGRGHTRAELATALAAAGEVEEARAIAAAEVAAGRAAGRPSMELASLTALGRAHGGDEALDAFSAAVEAAPRSASPLLRAQAHVEYGSALRREGRRSDARDVLREGHDLAASVDARALQSRALEELVVAGAKPRRMLSSGVESLTPSERRVAEHAARGLSNREIAETLFVTRKTVELHLGRAYAKLEIRSRAQLGGALGSTALTAA